MLLLLDTPTSLQRPLGEKPAHNNAPVRARCVKDIARLLIEKDSQGTLVPWVEHVVAARRTVAQLVELFLGSPPTQN